MNSLKTGFKLTSEFFEEDIHFPENTFLKDKSATPVTQARVFRKEGVELVKAEDLQDIVSNSQGIEKVIVEKISVNEATKISLLFEPSQGSHCDDSFLIGDLEKFAHDKFLELSAAPIWPEEKGFLNFNIPAEEKKTVAYQKHVFERKGRRRAQHGHYYRAKDHVELYKVGNSYLEDFKAGLRSFSFSSCGLDEEREKTVLGILSFFNYHQDVSICVLTNNIQKSFYRKLATDLKRGEEVLFAGRPDLGHYRAEGFDAIEYDELRNGEGEGSEHSIEDFLVELREHYDLLLWDLPQRDVLDRYKEFYFPIIRTLDNVSFIIQKNITKGSEVNELISYFKRYQIAIKGAVFSDDTTQVRGASERL